MLVQAILQSLIFIFTASFSWLPEVTTLPTVLDVDIDAALVTGIGILNAFAQTVWPLADLMAGFGLLLTYFAFKMFLKFLIGHRAPGAH